MDEEEIDRLYGLPLSEFVRARQQLAAQLRTAGDRAAAGQVNSLRKPTVSAWAINQLARHKQSDVQALIQAGDRLRQAQTALLQGENPRQFHEATQAQKSIVQNLVRSGSLVLTAAGLSAGKTTLDRIETTLHAAAVDDGGRKLLEAGRLTEDLQPSGFEPIVALAPESAMRPRTAKAATSQGAHAGKAVRRQADTATTDRKEADRNLPGQARQAVLQARIELGDLRRSARDARNAADQARSAAETAERRAREAEDGAHEAEQRLQRSEAAYQRALAQSAEQVRG